MDLNLFPYQSVDSCFPLTRFQDPVQEEQRVDRTTLTKDSSKSERDS